METWYHLTVQLQNILNMTLPTAEKEKNDKQEKKLKPCCACPETKRVRDACIVENGEENCGKLIEAHKKCMRAAGFDI